jgi:diaminopimelate decarboxylase
LARQRTLPRLDEGDLVVLRDVGAYTMGMWSRHCSRGMPPVWGWSEAEGFTVLRAAESAEDLTRFWGATAGR